MFLFFAALAAHAQITWQSSYANGNLKQWSQVQCGGQGTTCPCAPPSNPSGAANYTEGSCSTNSTGQFPQPPNGSGRYQLVTPPAGQTGTALKINLQHNDYWLTDWTRNEVLGPQETPGTATYYGDGDDRYFAWSTWFDPTSFANFNCGSTACTSNPWNVFTQFHQAGDDYSPPMSFVLRASDSQPGKYQIQFLTKDKYDANDNEHIQYKWDTLPTGVWNDFVVHVHFGTSASTGLVELWYGVNGGAKTQLTLACPDSSGVARNLTSCPTTTLYIWPAPSDYNYYANESYSPRTPGTAMPAILKQGLYRQNDILDNVTLYDTDMVIGKTFADVTGGGSTGGGVFGIAPPDHVVIVIEENHSFSSIIGSPAAPYINSLAQQGALFTQSFAVEHPSQPNYLDLFSGANQGVTDDSCPHTFSTENLASELAAASRTFTGFSEDLPAAGSTVCTSGAYAEKHAPWVNFTNVPTASNQPFTSFPTDFTNLPTVSIVDPNLNDDMHDGTIAQGDTWLQQHIDSYVQFAQTHNSLLIVTWDEDDSAGSNQIATIFVGPMVKQGQFAETINHFNVLRTVEDLYGLTHTGSAATATPISDVWKQGSSGPTVNMTAPTNGSTVSGTITLSATASDPGGIAGVIFLVDGVATGSEITTAPYNLSFDTTTLANGTHTFAARARNTANATTTSGAVSVTVSNPTGTGQLTLTTPLALSPSSPTINQSTTATFTVQNTGTGPFSVQYFLAGARDPSNGNVDFPASAAVTLQPGQSYTYSASRTFATSGTYTAWPAYFDGTNWIELAPSHTSFTVTGTAPLFSDNFNRTTGLGANWSVLYGSYSTNGTQAVSGTPPANGNWAKLNATLGTNNYSVSADMIVPAGSLDSGLVARSNDSTNVDRTLYSAQIATDGNVYLYRRNEWNWTQLASAAGGIVAGTSYNVKLLVSGSSPVHLEVWLNGVQKISFNDSSTSQITTGVAGMVNYDANVKYDNYTVTTP
ncbi:MAG TPA: alkaline phosphatase family protein [Candidatus Angelobacter sp.]|jgi:hypothetical protein|nr:alkaline phosphatase family protein [Candidatus Angelobacter sp.]